MKLKELNPAFEHNGTRSHISLDCPVCKGHKIAIPIAPQLPGGQYWKMTGDSFDNISLEPSILHKTEYANWPNQVPRHCDSHFFIRNGEIIIC